MVGQIDKIKVMTVTHKQRLLIQQYLDHYYNKFSEIEKQPLSFKNQMQLLYDYVTHLEKK